MGTRLPSQRARLWRVACILAPILCLAAGRATATASLPDPVASYTIDVRYDAQNHSLSGRETIAWRNTAPQATAELRFHLYQNAFANSRSSFMNEAGEDWLDWAEQYPDPWGYTEIASVVVAGDERVGEATFVQPDDGNVEDRTVLAVPLTKAVAPGGRLTIEIEFTTKLPRVFSRSGYAGPFAFAAQWFPKLGVFDDRGWNCHQYHYTTEFYADFGTYDVTLDVPAESVVGATGELRQDEPPREGRRRLRFIADAVHDFAFAIDPRFEILERDIADVRVRLLIQPVHADQAERYLGSLQAAMTYYRETVGPYPYPTLTLVDPGFDATATGGMEYPQLITLGTTWWMPRGLRVPEIVTVHEFGHQYWHGMVANNEFEEAWLDEGVNSYFEGRIMDATYGAASYVDLFGFRVDSLTDARAGYLRSTSKDPITRAAWQFLDRRSYGAISYAKAALALETLARRFGEEKVTAALTEYFREWRFRHPKGPDLVAALGRSIDDDIGPFVAQVIEGTGVVDYAVTRVSSVEVPPLTGRPFDGMRAGQPQSPPPEEPPHYRSEVVVERLGDVQFPVQIEVQFDDGTSTTERWDGIDRWKRFEYAGSQRVDWAVIDPRMALPLDVNRLNNSRMRAAGTRGIVRLTSRWGFWFQSVLHILTGL